MITINDLIKLTNWEAFISSFILKAKKIKHSITTSDDNKLCVQDILRDTYTFNLVFSYVGLMMLLSKNEQWNMINKMLEDYIAEYYSDLKLAQKIKEMIKWYEQQKNAENYVRFLNKLYLKFNITQQEINTDQQICIVENQINNMLMLYPTLKISKNYLARKLDISNVVVQNNMITVDLTPNNFYKLSEAIDDVSVMHKIEDKYLSLTDEIMDPFETLIVLRNDLAKIKGHETYFKYINSNKYDNTNTIKDLITTLESAIAEKCKIELTNIYNFINRPNKTSIKITPNDVTRYIENQKSISQFDINVVIAVIFDIFKNHFNIVFVSNGIKTLWRNGILTYAVVNNKTKKCIGKLYIDLAENEEKNINLPLAIKLADKMQISDTDSTIVEIAIIGNFTQTINYPDVVLIFKEFGYVLQHLSYQSGVGPINYDDEFANFLPLLFEYFAHDNYIISRLQKKKNLHEIDYLNVIRKLNICFSLKQRCAIAKFDHIIHNSTELIDIIKKSNKKDKVLLNLYREIYANSFAPYDNIFDFHVNHIDPTVIVQEMNNSQGVLYANLMNEIFAYGIYWEITQTNKARKKVDNSVTFYENVLENSSISHRELLRNFIRQANINCYQLYVDNVLKIKLQTISNDTDYFDDKESDTESDKEQIIDEVTIKKPSVFSR